MVNSTEKIDSETSEPLMMSSGRQLAVNGFIAVMLGLIGFTIVSTREFWPICDYPMFSGLRQQPYQDSIEFYTVAGREQEEHVLGIYSMGHLQHAFVLEAILKQHGWPSTKSSKAVRSVIEEMRQIYVTRDPAWAGPVTLRAYLVHYTHPSTEGARPEIMGRTLLWEVTEPGP